MRDPPGTPSVIRRDDIELSGPAYFEREMWPWRRLGGSG